MNAISETPTIESQLTSAGAGMGGQIAEAGIYDLTHDEYHADPCVVPSLSCSIAKLLLRRSPLHAWQAHPRFGNVSMEPTGVMDDGSIVHAMMLGQAHLIETIRAVYGPKHERKGELVTDFKTAAAQEERDEIRGMGKIPVLNHRLSELIRCKLAALQQIDRADDGAAFRGPGRSEVCVVSREDDVMLRCLVDRLPDDPWLPPCDLKCTELSAAPGGWDRRLQLEYAFQDAFYRRVLAGERTARGCFIEPEPMRFFVIELNPPHGTSVMSAAEDLRAIAEIEVERAIRLWRQCTQADEWPGYPSETTWIGASAWQITQSENAAIVDAGALRAHIGAPANWNAVRALRAA